MLFIQQNYKCDEISINLNNRTIEHVDYISYHGLIINNKREDNLEIEKQYRNISAKSNTFIRVKIVYLEHFVHQYTHSTPEVNTKLTFLNHLLFAITSYSDFYINFFRHYSVSHMF